MTTALIADDDPLMRALLRTTLASSWPDLEICCEAENGADALRQLEARRPDIAFLDIRMPGLTGLEVARSIDAECAVVFVTACDDHAIEAFEANAMDYILKPLDPARVVRLVGKLQRMLSSRRPQSASELIETLSRMHGQLAFAAAAKPVETIEWLQVSMGATVRMVHANDVMFFESDTKYTRVVSAECDGLIRLSLKELLGQIDRKGFQQTHRSTVVNRRFIRCVHRTEAGMELELRNHPARLKVSVANQHLFRSM